MSRYSTDGSDHRRYSRSCPPGQSSGVSSTDNIPTLILDPGLAPPCFRAAGWRGAPTASSPIRGLRRTGRKHRGQPADRRQRPALQHLHRSGFGQGFLRQPRRWSRHHVESSLFRTGIADCNFFKIDIEGGEYSVLPAMAAYLKATGPHHEPAAHRALLPAHVRSPGQGARLRNRLLADAAAPCPGGAPMETRRLPDDGITRHPRKTQRAGADRPGMVKTAAYFPGAL